MKKDIQTLLNDILTASPNKIIVSNPRSKMASEYKKIVVAKKIIKGQEAYQIEKYTETQVFHTNISTDELGDWILIYLSGEYKQINIFSDRVEMDIKINKDNNCYCNEKILDSDITPVRMVPESNNRRKNYFLQEGENIPVFVELGIFTSDYKVVNSMYDKFKQINRFTELVDDVLKTYSKKEINIIDFGCGKSYLTFVLYHYLVEIKHIKANIIGLDLKADVIKHCNELAVKFGYSGLRFEIGNINGYKCPFDVDMVVTLHACDTATDFALYNAISWNAGIILSVPCCQHEINKQISTDKLSGLTKYGIIKERTSALITDAIRGCMLEYMGYKTEIIEFIDIEHSPKNILIRARKANISVDKKKKSLEEAKNLALEFGCEQKLMALLCKQDKNIIDN